MSLVVVCLMQEQDEERNMSCKRSTWLWTIWLWTILCVALIWTGAGSNASGQNMPEKIMIDKGTYNTDIYEGVQFDHGRHAMDLSIACKVCHHEWKQNESKVPGKCSDCHAGKGGEGISLRDAYMNKCRGCHSNLKLEGKPAGPTRCNGCHPRKKSAK